MALRQCEKCSEMVDDAKAFCPGCGHSFVEEEKRQQSSGFEQMDSTVQLGQTMYNQMLTDMGLKGGKPGDKPQAQTLTPIEPAAPAPKHAEAGIPKPSVASPARSKWVLLTVGLALLLAAVVIIAAAILLFLYLPSLR